MTPYLWQWASVSSRLPPFIFMLAIGCEGAMSFELILGAVISVGMLVYLIFALLRPEKI